MSDKNINEVLADTQVVSPSTHPSEANGTIEDIFNLESTNLLSQAVELSYTTSSVDKIKDYLNSRSHLIGYYIIGGYFADDKFVQRYHNSKVMAYIKGISALYKTADKNYALIEQILGSMRVSLNTISRIDKDIVVADLYKKFSKDDDRCKIDDIVNNCISLYTTKNELYKSHYDEELRKITTLMAVKAISSQFINNVYDNGMVQFDDDYKKYVKQVMSVKRDYDNYDDDDDMFDIDNFIAHTDCKYIPTGIDFLDKKIGGGLRRSGINLISAPSGGGKTQWAVAVAEYCSRHGYKVLHIDLEMDKYELMARYYARMSGVPAKDMSDYAKMDRAGMCGYFKQIQSRIQDGTLDIVAGKSMSMDDIINYVNTAKASGAQYDLIIIDYLAEIVPPLNSKDPYQTQFDNARALNQLALDNKCAILTFSQLNKDGQAKKKTDDKTGANAIEGSVGKTYKAVLSIIVDNKDQKDYTIHIDKIRGCEQYDLPIKLNMQYATARISDLNNPVPADYKDSQDAELQRIANLSEYKYNIAHNSMFEVDKNAKISF